MSGDRISVTFACKKCGASPATLELPDDYTDNDIAKCKACGFEFGKYGKLKADAMNAVKGHASDMFRDAFKGVKGFKVK